MRLYFVKLIIDKLCDDSLHSVVLVSNKREAEKGRKNKGDAIKIVGEEGQHTVETSCCQLSVAACCVGQRMRSKFIPCV